MARYTEILRNLPEEAFASVFAATSRREREGCLRRLGVRVAAQGGLPRPQERARAKLGALRAALARTEDEELAEAVLRAWLMQRRPMLAGALDHFGIPHDNGLTDSDAVARLAGLDPAARAELTCALAPLAAGWEVDAYLGFLAAGAEAAGSTA